MNERQLFNFTPAIEQKLNTYAIVRRAAGLVEDHSENEGQRPGDESGVAHGSQWRPTSSPWWNGRS